jgi:site-specific DNA-cytosine methylase
VNTYVKQHRAASITDYESWREDTVTPTLNAMDNTSDSFATVLITEPEPPITFAWQNGGGYGNANDGLAITQDGVGPLSVSQTPAVSIHEPPDWRVRRITPLEAERLQGFDDNWTNVPGPKGKPQSDSQRYKQLGNAVTVPVAHYVGLLVIAAVGRLDG